MNKIREEGVVFSRAYTAGPKCAPSRISMLTGRYASRNAHAVNGNGQNGQTTNRTLVSVPSSKLTGVDVTNTLQYTMQTASFQTIFAGKWHLSTRAQGVAQFGDYGACTAQVSNSGFANVGGTYEDNIPSDGVGFTHNLEWCAATAFDYVRTAVDASTPFFLYFAPTAPHGPSIATALALGSIRQTPENAGDDMLVNDPVSGMPARNTIAGRGPANNGKNDINLDANLGAVWVDDSLGALINLLKEKNIYDETLIIVTMDHGQIAKDSLYEGGTRVALMARFPGAITGGSVVSLPVSNLDLAPTILTAVGLTIPSTLEADGMSWWRKAADKLEEDTATADPIDSRACIVSEIELSRSAVCGSLKFISNWDGADGAVNNYPASANAEQLYNLESDPTEQTNLVDNSQYTDAVVALRSFLACHDVDTTREANNATCDKLAISVPTEPAVCSTVCEESRRGHRRTNPNGRRQRRKNID